jgi:hypothetical protein
MSNGTHGFCTGKHGSCVCTNTVFSRESTHNTLRTEPQHGAVCQHNNTDNVDSSHLLLLLSALCFTVISVNVMYTFNGALPVQLEVLL